MSTITIHFAGGGKAEFTAADPELIAGTLNVDPHGTTRINHSDGTSIIINRMHMTYATLTDVPPIR